MPKTYDQLKAELSALESSDVTQMNANDQALYMAQRDLLVAQLQWFEDQRSDWQRMADLEMAADKAMYEDDEEGSDEEPEGDEPDGYCCDDCAIAAANNDYSGMDDKQEAATRAGLKRLGTWVVTGKEVGFMHSRCDICNGLPGNRHEFFLPENDDVEDLGEVCEDLGIENVEDLNQEAK
jgi:hypothetical protein